MHVYKIAHYYDNPRNNYTVDCATMNEAIAELRKMSSESGYQVSYLYRNGTEIAGRLWTRKNIAWNHEARTASLRK